MAAYDDPITLLMTNTESGVLSVIAYDKEDGRDATTRLIEPRSLVEGVSGVLVRSIQIEPKRGVRSFMARRIVSVDPSDQPLITGNNRFCDGEIILTGQQSKRSGRAQSPFDEPWFVQYTDLVREAVDDYQIEGWELDRVEATRSKLGLTLGQIRAVHAYVFAEYLIAFAIDGDLDANEEEQIEQIAECLDQLGWRPG